MSHPARTWAYKQSVGNPIKKFLLLEIADYANEDGYSYAGQETYAEILECEVRTIRRHMQALEDEGYIRRERRHRDDNTRTSDGCWLLAPEDELKPPKTSAKNGSKPTGQNVRKGETYRTMTTDLPDTESGPINRTEPLGEPSVVEDANASNVTHLDGVSEQCLQLLRQIPRFPRDESNVAKKLHEYRNLCPSVDAVEVCDDYKAYCEHKNKRNPNLLQLRNFFKTAAKNTNGSAAGNGTSRAPGYEALN